VAKRPKPMPLEGVGFVNDGIEAVRGLQDKTRACLREGMRFKNYRVIYKMLGPMREEIRRIEIAAGNMEDCYQVKPGRSPKWYENTLDIMFIIPELDTWLNEITKELDSRHWWIVGQILKEQIAPRIKRIKVLLDEIELPTRTVPEVWYEIKNDF